MRRAIVELPRQDPRLFEKLPDLGVVEAFRVVHMFHFDPKAFAGICRVKFEDPKVKPDQLVGHIGIQKVSVLARLADGASLVYFQGKPTVEWAKFASMAGGRPYPAFELTPANWRTTVVGSNAEIKKFLAELRAFKVRYKVLSIKDGAYCPACEATAPRSPLGILTPKQRQAIATAYKIGYYDIPRRAESADVARALQLGKSTTIEHLRKAEKRVLDEMMTGNSWLPFHAQHA